MDQSILNLYFIVTNFLHLSLFSIFKIDFSVKYLLNIYQFILKFIITLLYYILIFENYSKILQWKYKNLS